MGLCLWSKIRGDTIDAVPFKSRELTMDEGVMEEKNKHGNHSLEGLSAHRETESSVNSISPEFNSISLNFRQAVKKTGPLVMYNLEQYSEFMCWCKSAQQKVILLFISNIVG